MASDQIPAVHTPTLELSLGLNHDITLNGPGISHATVPTDWTTYTAVRFSSDSLGIAHTTADSAQLETADTGADLLVHLKVADIATDVNAATVTAPSDYFYQIHTQNAAGEWSPSGPPGVLEIRAKA